MQSAIGAVTVTLGLILGNAYFVAAEYALVSTRRGKIESLAKRGSLPAKSLLLLLDDLAPAVAACQIGITLMSIALGSFAEPVMEHLLGNALGALVDKRIALVASFALVTFLLLVFGELVPKYLSLNRAESLALRTHRLLKFFILLFKPLIFLAQRAAGGILKPLGIDLEEEKEGQVSREELLMMVQATNGETGLEKWHADYIVRALRMDALIARDLMIHRVDIKWLDLNATPEELQIALKSISHNRIPVCRGDIDDLVGVVYLQDIVRALPLENLKLEKLLRPAVIVPENLTVEKMIATMRDQKTQILIISDEYGGTSGLVTLEDVVEEIFGDMEDRTESERPPIELIRRRLVAKSTVRYDEVLDFLELDPGEDPDTSTLATRIIDGLGRVPKLGDRVESPIGTIRVDNMARRRITRVSIQLSPDVLAQIESNREAANS